MGTKKKSGLTVFLSIYFIVFGLLFLTNAFYCREEKTLKEGVYLRTQKKLPFIKEKISTRAFLRSDYKYQKEILLAVKSFEQEINKFKKDKLDKCSLWAVLISITGTFVGILFVVIGGGIITRRDYPFKIISPTLILLAFFTALYFYNMTRDIKYYDAVSVRVWEISAMFSRRLGENVHLELARSFTKYLFFRTIIFICFVMLFYLLPLVYLLNMRYKERHKFANLQDFTEK